MAILAIDIGGTKIKAGIVSKDYSLLSSIRISTNPKQGKTKILSSLRLIVTSLIEGSKHKITAIGISMPGRVDDVGKILECGTVLSFLVGFNLKKYLEKYFKIPVIVKNDSLCFTVAESIFGAGKNHSDVLGVIWGSGVGAAIVKDSSNKKLSSNFCSTLEFGHSYVYDSYSNKYVKLELLIGGSFIKKRYSDLGGKIKNPTVGDIYSSKERLAKNLMRESFELLGMSLANLINLVNPDVVVLGGGVAKLPSSAYKLIFSQLKKYSLPSHIKGVTLRRFKISDDEGLLGAAYLASLGK